VCARRWCGALRGAMVKSSSGSLWPAARALPRHVIHTSARATVSTSSFLSAPLSSLWPRSLTIWPRLVCQDHRLNLCS
jgi:hypothetical protein